MSLENLRRKFNELRNLNRRLTRIQESLGRIELRQLEAKASLSLEANEFRAFSQWGEDGIIQFLLRHVPIRSKTFIEFGVENYTEANTRFLLSQANWRGLVIDGSRENIDSIYKSGLCWAHDLKAVHAFITRDNINEIIEKAGFAGPVGILSVDIDGNDYWVWQAINIVDPDIVIVEYNHRFGKKRAVTVPYAPNFVRSRAHHSMIYYGASLQAFCKLAEQKGMAFVGCNSAGNNAFFVKKSIKPEILSTLSPEEGFRAAKFHESHDAQGRLNYLSPLEEEALLASLPLVEV